MLFTALLLFAVTVVTCSFWAIWLKRKVYWYLDHYWWSLRRTRNRYAREQRRMQSYIMRDLTAPQRLGHMATLRRGDDSVERGDL